MTFSIKAIIRAFAAPDHAIVCQKHLWRQIVGEIERRGGHKTEAGAFLLGREAPGPARIENVVFYDDLDPNAYSSGACILHSDAFAKLWAICRAHQMTVLADVHSHPGVGFQSHEDRTNPMVARAGHVAIILPDYARWPVNQRRFGIYEYRGSHEWADRRPVTAPGFFYTGFWS
jgi:hypothetical protein